jgi:predicted small metal-binding protein
MKGRIHMARKVVDCRAIPNEIGCTLAISGKEDEVLDAAVAHAVAAHGHSNTPELREQLRQVMQDEKASVESR